MEGRRCAGQCSRWGDDSRNIPLSTGEAHRARGFAVIAFNENELHGINNLTKQTALNEKGMIVNGRGDTPNTHDILTGSTADGRAFPATPGMTCGH